MRTSGRWIVRSGVAAMLLLVGAAAGAQTLSAAQKAALKDFVKRAQAYESAEHALPDAQLKPTSDVQQLEQRRVALRTAVQRSRPQAKQGDLFTPEAADVFRLLLGETMAGRQGVLIRASLAHAEPIAPADVKVNAVWPDMHGQPLQSVPPTLLANLPILPKGLEYRVAARTLAVRDTEANICVDFLPDALP